MSFLLVLPVEPKTTYRIATGLVVALLLGSPTGADSAVALPMDWF